MTKIKRQKRNRHPWESKSCISFLLVFLLCLALAGLWSVSTTTTTANNKNYNNPSSLSQEMKHHTALTNPKHHNVEKFYKQSNNAPMDLIKEGHLHLINLEVSSNPFRKGRESQNAYSGISATFCHLDWKVHKEDPSSVPMFKDLQQQSSGCRKKSVSVDLGTAVMEARKYDEKHSGSKIKSLAPKGFVFHESRCGSTLVANSLASFQPDLNRVYSESGPPITAAKMFDPEYEQESIQLLQDVIYLMGRTNDLNEENLFFKVQSIGSKSIGVFRKAFPLIPWIYVYRNPIQVLKSHLKVKGTDRAVCLRSKRHPGRDIKLLANEISDMSPEKLSTEQFCAAHLATLCEAAERQINNSSGVGRLVNYVDIPQILIKDIIPKHFLKQSSSLSPEAIDRVMEVNQKYSKGRATGREWTEDSKTKEDTAWAEMKDAAKEYLFPVYDRMETIRLGNIMQ